METLHAPANPWPALVFALAAAIAWATTKVRDRMRRAGTRARREHERVTGWFDDLRSPGAGPAVMRDEDTNRIILPSQLLKGRERQPGRHRAAG